jgi:pimeloyl-ACP methyl ester carboxylesterase
VPSVRLNGCSIYYEVAGEGAPLLFMHGGFGGLGTGAVTTENLSCYEEFTQRYTVITYDRRSSGRLSSPESPHGLELLFISESLHADFHRLRHERHYFPIS